MWINWQLGLVMLSCIPFIGATVAAMTVIMSGSSQEGTDYYAKAGGVANEVIVNGCDGTRPVYTKPATTPHHTSHM